MAFLDNNGVTRLVADLKSKFATLVSGAVAVVQGGTGKTTHTTNAVLTGNGANAVNNVATADGALYATAANGAAQFGTLPIAQGGTAGTTKTEARTSLEVPVNSSIAYVESVTAKTNHAVGDYFMLGDTLMKATAAIATGETINDSNAVPATVQSQIDALRDSVSENILPSASGQNYVRFSRCHKTCTVNIYLTGSIEFGTSYKWIATVPTNARPANDIYAPVFDSSGNPLGGTLCIARDGNVGIKLSATATPYVLTNIAWVV